MSRASSLFDIQMKYAYLFTTILNGFLWQLGLHLGKTVPVSFFYVRLTISWNTFSFLGIFTSLNLMSGGYATHSRYRKFLFALVGRNLMLSEIIDWAFPSNREGSTWAVIGEMKISKFWDNAQAITVENSDAFVFFVSFHLTHTQTKIVLINIYSKPAVVFRFKANFRLFVFVCFCT